MLRIYRNEGLRHWLCFRYLCQSACHIIGMNKLLGGISRNGGGPHSPVTDTIGDNYFKSNYTEKQAHMHGCVCDQILDQVEMIVYISLWLPLPLICSNILHLVNNVNVFLVWTFCHPEINWVGNILSFSDDIIIPEDAVPLSMIICLSIIR